MNLTIISNGFLSMRFTAESSRLDHYLAAEVRERAGEINRIRAQAERQARANAPTERFTRC